MKPLSSLACAAALCGFLSACDSTAPKTVTKTVIDTIYTDRFAHTAAVVWGEWTVKTGTDSTSTDAVFLQDSSAVTAYIYWKSGTWVLTGTVVDTTLNLMSSSPLVLMNGVFRKSSAGKVTLIGGSGLAQGSSTAFTWTAQRKM